MMQKREFYKQPGERWIFWPVEPFELRSILNQKAFKCNEMFLTICIVRATDGKEKYAKFIFSSITTWCTHHGARKEFMALCPKLNGNFYSTQKIFLANNLAQRKVCIVHNTTITNENYCITSTLALFSCLDSIFAWLSDFFRVVSLMMRSVPDW